MDIYERLDEMSADTAEARAANILHGLGNELILSDCSFYLPR